MSIDQHIKSHLGCKINDKQTISTGEISSFKILTSTGLSIFAKYQDIENNNLINQANELLLLSKSIGTPKVLGFSKNCLLLEWIETSHNSNHHAEIGKVLANLHKRTNQYFGFDHDNTIGEMPQYNAVNQSITSWSFFFWEYRLLFQIKYALKSKLINHKEYKKLLLIKLKLKNLLSSSIKPSLLHGDLWSGNVISAINGPVFIDTSCYYGHSEADLALTYMFGGFSKDFYRSYEVYNPLESGYEQRKPIYMLYHYLNHLNIFGHSYHPGVLSYTNQILDS
jgi:fructosamine-3-kinase